jgi:excisionase family DNA binding protein
MHTDKTFTVAEAAARLGVSVDTVRRRVQAGSLEKVQMEEASRREVALLKLVDAIGGERRT